MADTMLAALSPEERVIADNILCASPNYRYDLRCSPPIDPLHPRPALLPPQSRQRRWWPGLSLRRFD